MRSIVPNGHYVLLLIGLKARKKLKEDDMRAKYRSFSLAVGVAAVLAAVHIVAQTPAFLEPSDFGMRFEFGLCTTDVLDTFQGVFMRDMGPHAPLVSRAVNVPAEALAAAWRAISEAQFFDYQSNFRHSGNAVIAPALHYRLEVHNAGHHHIVTWRDSTRPSTPEADRLRGMFDALIRIVTELPEVQRLPLPGVGCA